MEGPAATSVALSIVVVVHNMARELTRTLRSLSSDHQLGLPADSYELIVVDNGSADPIREAHASSFPENVQLVRVHPAPPSPAMAANRGLALARGDLVGLIIDGARMGSPGLLAGALRASLLSPRPVITAPAFHLGDVPHMRAVEVGYDQEREDELLAGSGWEDDGYRLFEISTPAGSSGRGLFGPMGESSSLFMPRELWDELGGLDERFALPGGGLVNHDLYRRACELPCVELIVLLGEGTFHQHHGGAATSRRFTWDEMHDDYKAIAGRDHSPPDRSPLYVGRLPLSTMRFVEESAQWAARQSGPRRPGGPS